MQIHLFDCKSSVPLRRGLGKNKLNLCMLVLTQLRNTYWSASVIYRLFERAQSMLDKAKDTTESHTRISPQRTEAGITNQDPGIDYPQQSRHHQDIQQELDFGSSTQVIPRSNLQVHEHNVPNAFWLNDSGFPCFSNVDHLLSPGFFVSENVFQHFAGYDNGTGIVDGYDQYTISLPL
jgi:hypothetical protein